MSEDDFAEAVSRHAMLMMGLGGSGAWLTAGQYEVVQGLVRWRLGVGERPDHARSWGMASDMPAALWPEEFESLWNRVARDDVDVWLVEWLVGQCFFGTTSSWINGVLAVNVEEALKARGVSEWGVWPEFEGAGAEDHSEWSRREAFKRVGWLV